MSNRQESAGGTRSWISYLLGCGGAVLLITAILVLLNWSKATRIAYVVKQTVQDIETVQSAVAAKYAPAQVIVNRKYNSKIQGPILSVQVTNYPALRNLAHEQARAKAIEIATTARDALKTREYQHFEVILATSIGPSVVVTNNQEFVFELSELPPRPPGSA